MRTTIWTLLFCSLLSLIACGKARPSASEKTQTDTVPAKEAATRRTLFFLRGCVKELKLSYTYSEQFLSHDTEGLFENASFSVSFDEDGNFSTLSYPHPDKASSREYTGFPPGLRIWEGKDDKERYTLLGSNLLTDIIPIICGISIEDEFQYDQPEYDALPYIIHRNITFGGDGFLYSFYIKYKEKDTHGNYTKAEYVDTKTGQIAYVETREITYY